MNRITAPSALSPEADDRLRRELEPGEELLWSDQPVPAAYARHAWPICLFGVPFFLFSVFWIFGAGAATWFGQGGSGPGGGPASGAGQGLFMLFPLFGTPFVLVGLFLVTAPIRERNKARRAVYALTDRRAITITPRVRDDVVNTYPPDQLAIITRHNHRDGTGDVVFGDLRPLMLAAAGSPRNGIPQMNRAGFVGIRDAHEVERMVRALAATKAT